jgi:hypothetical protein
MPEVGWIDALKRYNLGGTAWCIPRKGTPAYEQIMKIRKGEEVKTPKQLIDELEKKTGGKPKTPKKSMTISLEEKKEEKKEEKPKKKRTVKAMVKKESAVEMPMYQHEDEEYKRKLEAFKKMVGAK